MWVHTQISLDSDSVQPKLLIWHGPNVWGHCWWRWRWWRWRWRWNSEFLNVFKDVVACFCVVWWSLVRPPRYLQGTNDDASVNRLALPIASFPGSRVAELHRQQLNENNSSSHITTSQPNPGRASSIRHGDAGSSSQPIGNDVIPNSPRRTRSQGLTNAYRLCYRRQGFEQS